MPILVMTLASSATAESMSASIDPGHDRESRLNRVYTPAASASVETLPAPWS